MDFIGAHLPQPLPILPDYNVTDSELFALVTAISPNISTQRTASFPMDSSQGLTLTFHKGSISLFLWKLYNEFLTTINSAHKGLLAWIMHVDMELTMWLFGRVWHDLLILYIGSGTNCVWLVSRESWQDVVSWERGKQKAMTRPTGRVLVTWHADRQQGKVSVIYM